MTEPTALTVWTIYDHPRDYPDKFVVRGWDIPARGPATARTACRTFDDVRAAREYVAQQGNGLTCIGRYAQDDPSILESWV